MDDSKGSGLTFSEADLKNAKVILALIGKPVYSMDFKGIVETYPALVWFANLIPAIERNILEAMQVIEPIKGSKKK